MKLIVTGSIAFDYLMSFPGKFSDHFLPDKLDSISISFLVESLIKRRGGCAANIAYNLALLGERALLVGCAGQDFSDYKIDLQKIGVDTSGVVEIKDEYTASFFGNSDIEGNQICSFYSGAMRHAGEIELKKYIDSSDSLVIISPNDPDAMISYSDQCKNSGCQFIFDPGQQTLILTPDQLKKGADGAKILILNDYELSLFKKKTKITDEDLLSLSEIVIVTLGEKGAEIRTNRGNLSVPPVKPEKILDPTGVGDGFRAGLLKGIVHNLPLEIVGRMGTLAATYVLEADGPQSHSYTFKEFVERYCDAFGETEKLRRLVEKNEDS